ncbi:acyloxyacyl hydrolase [Phenylobacterium sp.]|uniref:acyloxyacyl hydrolase n=1 Tax=Phenylobacterium sp. TaxID=1871053 RepID=UPI0039832095
MNHDERTTRSRALICLLPLLLLASPAGPVQAGEILSGVLGHDVETPLTLGGYEGGADLQLGWRGARIGALRVIGSPSPYVFGSLSTAGETNFAAAGLSWRIGGDLYVRPGIGVAVHDRKSLIIGEDRFRRDLGSRVLFEPEIGVGYQLNERLSMEVTWVHISQGQLFSAQNPGMDSIGVRLNYRLR